MNCVHSISSFYTTAHKCGRIMVWVCCRRRRRRLSRFGFRALILVSLVRSFSNFNIMSLITKGRLSSILGVISQQGAPVGAKKGQNDCSIKLALQD